MRFSTSSKEEYEAPRPSFVSRAATLPTHPWDQAETWHVLDRDGTPLGRLMLPLNARLEAVRSDRAVLIVRDELDVQHLRVYAVERSSRR